MGRSRFRALHGRNPRLNWSMHRLLMRSPLLPVALSPSFIKGLVSTLPGLLPLGAFLTRLCFRRYRRLRFAASLIAVGLTVRSWRGLFLLVVCLTSRCLIRSHRRRYPPAESGTRVAWLNRPGQWRPCAYSSSLFVMLYQLRLDGAYRLGPRKVLQIRHGLTPLEFISTSHF